MLAEVNQVPKPNFAGGVCQAEAPANFIGADLLKAS